MNSVPFFTLLDELLAEAKDGLKVIRFIVPDFFVDQAGTENLTGKKLRQYSDLDVNEKLHQIVDHADSMFDVFRHNFFVRFEKETDGGINLDAPEMFKLYSELCFVNTIIPFFVAERIWIRNT